MPVASRTQTIADRIRILCGYLMQSEVARRTGIPQASIAYYIAGRRIPASFCARLIDELGVDARWLLLGQGDPWYNSASPKRQAVVERLHASLDRLNHVQHERLRSLANGLTAFMATAASLREQETKLRSEMDLDLIPACDDLIMSAHRAIGAKRFVVARSILVATRKLVALSHNQQTRLHLLQLSGYVETSSGAHADGLRFNQRALDGWLALEHPERAVKTVSVSADVVGMASAAGMPHYALRISNVILACFRFEIDHQHKNALRALVRRGGAQFALGVQARTALADEAHALMRMVEPDRSGSSIQYSSSIVESGYLRAREYAGANRRSIGGFRALTRELLLITMVRQCALSEDPADLRWVERVYRIDRNELVEARARIHLAHLDALCELEAGRLKRAIMCMRREVALHEAMADVKHSAWLYASAAMCQVLRRAGEHAQALALACETDAKMVERSKVMTFSFPWRALHAMNLLALIDDTEGQQHVRRMRDVAIRLLKGGEDQRFAFCRSILRRYGTKEGAGKP